MSKRTNVNLNGLLISFSILGIISGLILFFINFRNLGWNTQSHVNQPQPEKAFIDIRVENRLPASTVEQKLKNTYISGKVQNSRLGKVLVELLKKAEVEQPLSLRSDFDWSLMKTIKVSDSFEHIPISAAILRILKMHGLKCFVSSHGVCIKGSATVNTFTDGEWEVELIAEN